MADCGWYTRSGDDGVPSQVEAGRVGLSALWTPEVPGPWDLEQFKTQDDLDRQLRSDRCATLLAIMETASLVPRMNIQTVTEIRGLDYIRAVRLQRQGGADRGGPV